MAWRSSPDRVRHPPIFRMTAFAIPARRRFRAARSSEIMKRQPGDPRMLTGIRPCVSETAYRISAKASEYVLMNRPHNRGSDLRRRQSPHETKYFDLSHLFSSIITDSRTRSSIRFSLNGRTVSHRDHLTHRGLPAWVEKYWRLRLACKWFDRHFLIAEMAESIQQKLEQWLEIG